MAALGRTMILYVGGDAVAGTRTNRIESKAELIQRSSPNTATAKEFVAGDTEWSASAGFLVTLTPVFLTLLQVGNTFDVVFGATGQTSSTKSGLKGQAILQQCTIDANVDGLITGTFVFKGTGALTAQ